jgi:hypothetical protein
MVSAKRRLNQFSEPFVEPQDLSVEGKDEAFSFMAERQLSDKNQGRPN